MADLKIDQSTALNLIENGENIHAFYQSESSMMGCDFPKNHIIDLITKNPSEIYLTGNLARSMNHGIAVNRKYQGLLFIATKPDVDWTPFD